MSQLPAPDPVPDGTRRPVAVVHLVFGLLFAGIAAVWALGESNAITGEHLALLGPGVLVVAGVVGLAASLVNARRRPSTDTPGEDR